LPQQVVHTPFGAGGQAADIQYAILSVGCQRGRFDDFISYGDVALGDRDGLRCYTGSANRDVSGTHNAYGVLQNRYFDRSVIIIISGLNVSVAVRAEEDVLAVALTVKTMSFL